MATLTTMLDRVETLLVDSPNVIFSTATLTEGIRLAVGEYGTANEAAVTLEGLDGAASSSLPAVHESMIVVGAAAYAVQARAVDRAESYQEGGESDKLKAWGDARLTEFKAMLGFIFPSYLVALAGSSGSGDATKIAAEVALLGAQAALVAAQEAAVTGQESRAAAAEVKKLADETANEARIEELRHSVHSAWGTWEEEED